MAQVGGKVYAAKGNNSLEFWRYSPDVEHWTQLADVPAGGGKTVKEGAGATGLTVNDTGYVYLLKGSGTHEFYRYNTVTNTWETKVSAPAGASGKPFKHGSCLTCDGSNTIYALKGSCNEFYAYSVDSNKWSTLTSLPFYGRMGKKRKAYDGAGLACVNDSVYALKGGNTRELWRYDVSGDSWCQQADMPPWPWPGPGKNVKGGGAIVGVGNHLCALKGNNTLEFYAYYPGGLETPPGTPLPTPPAVNETLIAAGEDVFAPRWNPASDSVVFVKRMVGYDQIFKTSLNGGDGSQLTSIDANCSEPVWSGDKIAFLVTDTTSLCSQISIMPSSGGTPTILTNTPFDREGLEWSPGGDALIYEREGDGGYIGVFTRDTTVAGSEVALTTSPYDHSHPVYRSANQIVCGRETDEGYDQIFALTQDSTGWTETPLTSGLHDHENPVAASNGIVAFEITDDNGFTQIGRVNADSAGSEAMLTSGPFDFESPTITSDGREIHCLRHSDQGSAICRVDAATGCWLPISDEQTEREHPCVTLNSALCIITSVYEREWEGIYRTAGERTIFDPIARVEINPGSPPPPGFMKATDLPMAVLHCEVHDSLMHAPDSLLIWRSFSLSLADTAPVGNKGTTTIFFAGAA